MNNRKELADYHQLYSEYYDLLTSHKDYLGEVDILLRHLKRLGFGAWSSVISVGCGTGSHERLIARHVKNIQGVDQSRHMISVAKSKGHEPNLSFSDEPLRSLLKSYYDVGLSLFNVINCIERIEELSGFINDLGGAIRAGGILILEAWNSDEIFANPPSIVTRHYCDSGTSLIRTAIPSFSCDKDRLVLDYIICGEQNGRKFEFESRHNIYLHSRELIETCLVQAGFGSISWFSALSDGHQAAKKGDRMLLVTARKL